MTDSSLTLYNGGGFIAPSIDIENALVAYQAKKDFIDRILKEGIDFGPIPGSDKKTLLKPGAEKLANLYGFCPIFEDVETIEDWTGANHSGETFFYYRQKCKLFRGDRMAGSADGSCNSWEKKYRYRWVGAEEVPAHLDKSKLKTRGGKISEFAFAIDKAETSGKYGKPAEYWKAFTDAIANGSAMKTTRKTGTGKVMDAWEIGSLQYQVPNDDVAEQVNTILKMAQKRALVAAVLITTGASDYFTQDMEDFIDGSYTFVPEPVTTTPPTNGNGKQARVTPDPIAPITQAAQAMGAVVTDSQPEESPADNPFDEPAAPIAPPKQKMSLEMAATVKNRDGVAYTDIDSETLSHMSRELLKSFKTRNYTPEQKSECQFKIDAIAVLLQDRANR